MAREFHWRHALAILAFILIVGGAVDLPYLAIFHWDRGEVAARVGALRFGKMPGIRSFLEAIDQQTEPGQAIALVIPSTDWDQGYEYAFYRAAYVLAGRTVLPVITPDDRRIPANIARADLVAFWRVEPDPKQFEIVWRGQEGFLARRVP